MSPSRQIRMNFRITMTWNVVNNKPSIKWPISFVMNIVILDNIFINIFIDKISLFCYLNFMNIPFILNHNL